MFGRKKNTEKVLGKVYRICVYLHQNNDLQMGPDEASMRVGLGWALEKSGIGVTRGMVNTLIYEDMDQRENQRIFLIADNSVVIDVRTINAVVAYHRDQLAKFLVHTQRPLGLIVNFYKELFEPEMIRVTSESAR